MVKRILILFIVGLFFLTNTSVVLAERGVGESCGSSYPADPSEPCVKDYDCIKEAPIPGQGPTYSCKYSPVSTIFGKVKPPDALKKLMGKDQTGAAGISQFLTNLVALIYSLAGIVLIFMLLWGAFGWMTSEGDKEKLAAAQRKIINAIIGIILFAIAFAVIAVLGQFTGFKFFFNT